MPGAQEPAVMDTFQVRLLDSSEVKRCHQLLDEQHYLKSPKPVGERLYYVGTGASDQWLALLVFTGGSK